MDPLIETLVRTRKARQLTQAALAELAGISRRALVAIEGGGDCAVSTLQRLFGVMDMELQAVPSVYRPPTLEDVMAENEALFQARTRGAKP